jgi:site-specific recombinase XerD
LGRCAGFSCGGGVPGFCSKLESSYSQNYATFVSYLEVSLNLLKDLAKQSERKALFEFLYSIGCRVGEVYKLNIEDINWENCSAIVNGKGSKQREVYFTLYIIESRLLRFIRKPLKQSNQIVIVYSHNNESE